VHRKINKNPVTTIVSVCFREPSVVARPFRGLTALITGCGYSVGAIAFDKAVIAEGRFAEIAHPKDSNWCQVFVHLERGVEAARIRGCVADYHAYRPSGATGVELGVAHQKSISRTLKSWWRA
jgi:hypothetical protein